MYKIYLFLILFIEKNPTEIIHVNREFATHHKNFCGPNLGGDLQWLQETAGVKHTFSLRFVI